ncbi:MAG TPA: DciA family protein [Blastocatellia bacterium]|nr:DciA family protein [Blastocatellia bacterium]
MNSLLKMLPAMIRLSGDNEEVREQAVFAAWKASTNYQLTQACAPFRLYRKTLVIATKDLTWKTQMERESAGLIFKLNSMLGAPLVTFIEFRVDPKHVEAMRPNDAHDFNFHHTNELMNELAANAAKIKDDALRETFLRAAARCLERKESH